VLSYVCEVPGGALPSYAMGYYARDNDYYVQWDSISRHRDSFMQWLNANVLDLQGTA